MTIRSNNIHLVPGAEPYYSENPHPRKNAVWDMCSAFLCRTRVMHSTSTPTRVIAPVFVMLNLIISFMMICSCLNRCSAGQGLAKCKLHGTVTLCGQILREMLNRVQHDRKKTNHQTTGTVIAVR